MSTKLRFRDWLNIIFLISFYGGIVIPVLYSGVNVLRDFNNFMFLAESLNPIIRIMGAHPLTWGYVFVSLGLIPLFILLLIVKYITENYCL